MFREFSRHVHGKRVLSVGYAQQRDRPNGRFAIDKCSANAAPRGVDERFFGYFGFIQWYGELDVTVDGVRDQRSSLVFGVDELRHKLSDFKDQLCGPLIVPVFCIRLW